MMHRQQALATRWFEDWILQPIIIITGKLNTYCMNNKKCNYKLYKLRLVENKPLIFGGATCSEEWDAPCNAILNDYQQKVMFEFVHPKNNGKKYERHYDRPAFKGYAELKVGRFRTKGDYAKVFINIASDTYEPYVAFYRIQPAFSNADVLAEIVARAFNWVLKGDMLCVKLDPWVPAAGEKIFWLKDCYETYDACEVESENSGLINFGFEKLKKKSAKRKTGDFRSYIEPGMEDLVMNWLRKEIGDTKDIVAFMRPMRAIARLNLFKDRPPMECFCSEFGKEGLIKLSTYNEYMNIDNQKCVKDRAYYKILDRASKCFGIIV